MVPTLAMIRSDLRLAVSTSRYLRLVLLAVLALNGGYAQATRVWFEKDVATVAAGYDAGPHKLVYRKFYLAAAGPDTLGASTDATIRTCTARVVGKLGDDFKVALWGMKQPSPARLPVTASPPASGSAKASPPTTDSMVDGMLGGATSKFRSAIALCSAGKFDATQFHLALVEHTCEQGSSTCANTNSGFAGQPESKAFSVLHQWVDSRDTQHPTLPLNSPILLLDAVADEARMQVLAGAAPSAELDACVKKVSSVAAAKASASAASAQATAVSIAASTALTGAERRTICLALRAVTLPLLESGPWSPPPSAQVAQKQFEALVLEARTLHRRVDHSVPQLIDIPVEVAVRVIDVLDAPAQAIKGLRSVPDARLLVIQDELARTRITECARFRGLIEPSKVSECSGYALDGASLNQCLALGVCNPALAAKGRADILAQVQASGMKSLSQASLLPRLDTSYKQLLEATNACAKSQDHAAAASCLLNRQLSATEKAAWNCVKDKAPNQRAAKTLACAIGGPVPANVASVVNCTQQFKNPQDQARCATDAALPPDVAKMVECQRLSKGKSGDLAVCMATKVAGGDVGQAANCLRQSGGDAASAATCYAEGKLPPEATKMIECQRQSNGNSSAFALCMTSKLAGGEAAIAAECLRKFKDDGAKVAECYALAKLPPEARAMAECQRQSKGKSDAFAGCMVTKLAGGEVGKAAACLQSSGSDWAKGAACYAAGQLPQPVVQAMACIQQAGGAAPALAGCMAAQNLPENLRKPVQCIAESQGDPLGAGVCMVSDGLTPDQRIGLECLVSTGGEPVSFATCAGGRLAVKELFNCVDKKLFEDKCMGTGNEFVKLAKTLGIDLRPETVVGQVLNFPLDVVKFEVHLAEDAAKGVGNVARETAHAADDVAKTVAKARDDAAQTAAKARDDAARTAAKARDDAERTAAKARDDAVRESARIADQAAKDAKNGLHWAEDRTGIHIHW